MLETNYSGFELEAGIDEAGRGCIAGPVVAAAVIFPKDYSNDLLNDSKQINEKSRLNLRDSIHENAIAWAIGVISNERIDKVNILNATFEAMHLAIKELKIEPEFLLIDGNRFKAHKIQHACIVKGDSKYQHIAAASILAKTYRDELMEKLDLEFPQYLWKQNKGYPTEVHREACEKFGLTIWHRKTFQCIKPKTLFD